jgi:hypothetical protein
VQFAYADMAAPSITIVIYQNSTLLSKNFAANILGCYPSNSTRTMISAGITTRRLQAINQSDPQRNCSWQVVGGIDSFYGAEEYTVYKYNIPGEFKLAVDVTGDKVYISNPVALPDGLFSTFRAYLKNDSTIDLVLMFSTESQSQLNQVRMITMFAVALIVTLVVELALGLFWPFNKKGIRMKLLATIFMANLVSVPIVWFGFGQLSLPFTNVLLLGEAFAVVFEAVVYFIVLRDVFKRFRDALFFSFVLNLASFLVGVLLVLFVPI